MAETIAETSRLRLRTWDAADIAPFMTALNTPVVMRWLGGVQSEDDFRAGVARWRQCQADHGYCFWIVERLSDVELLGFCGLKRVNAEGAPMIGDFEIGWRLREDAWGHGYAREAAEAALNLAFHRFDAPHVIAMTVRANAASWRLMQRLGMVRALSLDFLGRWVPTGPIENSIVYKITRGEWTQ
ncbi:MAG: GNAT family N-acetyltransferase [Sphingopyxis sp.]